MKYNSEEKFKTLTNNIEYIRVDDSHPLELYIGINSQGYQTIRFNGFHIKQKVKSCSEIEVSHYKKENTYSILFSNTSNSDIFYYFCNDLINTSRNCKPKDGYQFLINRYYKWVKMFSRQSNLLSPSQIMGLIGELLFLKDFAFDKYGISKAVEGWSGCELTHKDFSYDMDWYEIKTTESHKNTVHISSLEQLDSNDYNGNLVVYKLEKMAPTFVGLSLNDLIDEIIEKIEDEEVLDGFEKKLLETGYVYSSDYDEIVYASKETLLYEVREGFPRLKKDDLPLAVKNIKYEIILNMIEEYRENYESNTR